MGWWKRSGGVDGPLADDDLFSDDKTTMRMRKREVVEETVVIGGLVAVQLVFAANSVLLSYVMLLGLNPLTFVVFSAFATFLVLSPVAFLLERSLWPKKFCLKLIVQLVLISLGGVTMFQTLFLKGIKLTSVTMATAMPNLAPGLIFLIAWTVRLEKVNISCLYSKVKIVGTLLCVVGALAMSLMHSTASKESEMSSPSSSSPADTIFDKDKIIGCLYLMAAVFILSGNVVLQASALGDFPAPISLCSITSLIGVFTTAGVQLFEDGRFDLVWSNMSFGHLFGFSILAGLISGSCVSFNGWAMKKKGPVLVSMFSPISTVCTVVLSVFTLGETIKLGSLAGMFLMFTGLYFVLWAKGKEGPPESDDRQESEKLLLS
ncbi:hypothetical protein SAY86_012596 [Trapa natans]|uniref:WAT1-related protein n=1 Tax=Trapa natans TaxID=22666 RepID=A0AAN7MAA4_TRANT|nr:hypothetical protein SAY86_012596 [Trapa natans]